MGYLYGPVDVEINAQHQRENFERLQTILNKSHITTPVEKDNSLRGERVLYGITDISQVNIHCPTIPYLIALPSKSVHKSLFAGQVPPSMETVGRL